MKKRWAAGLLSVGLAAMASWPVVWALAQEPAGKPEPPPKPDAPRANNDQGPPRDEPGGRGEGRRPGGFGGAGPRRESRPGEGPRGEGPRGEGRPGEGRPGEGPRGEGPRGEGPRGEGFGPPGGLGGPGGRGGQFGPPGGGPSGPGGGPGGLGGPPGMGPGPGGGGFPGGAGPMGFRRNDPEMDELEAQDHQLDRQTFDLVARYRMNVPSEERAELKKQIQEVVTKHFELRQKKRQLQLTRMEKELQRMRDEIKRRSEAQSEIVGRRLGELLGERDPLDF